VASTNFCPSRRAFESVEGQRASALTAQFQKEFQRRGQEIVRAVNTIAASDDAIAIAKPKAATPTDRLRGETMDSSLCIRRYPRYPRHRHCRRGARPEPDLARPADDGAAAAPQRQGDFSDVVNTPSGWIPKSVAAQFASIAPTAVAQTDSTIYQNYNLVNGNQFTPIALATGATTHALMRRGPAALGMSATQVALAGEKDHFAKYPPYRLGEAIGGVLCGRTRLGKTAIPRRAAPRLHLAEHEHGSPTRDHVELAVAHPPVARHDVVARGDVPGHGGVLTGARIARGGE
jgi:hypothetical protein